MTEREILIPSFLADLFEYKKIQRYKDAKIQRCKDAKIQRYKDTKIKKDTNRNRNKYTKIFTNK